MKWRLVIAILLLPLPGRLKVILYRLLPGYRIGRGVRIGFSLLVADKCEIGANTSIGHFNLLYRSKLLRMGENVRIGQFNMLIGGDEVSLGEGCVIGRFNEINSILEPLTLTQSDPRLIIGQRSVITAEHKIDFGDKVEFGNNVVFAGRNSNIWTHNRQRTAPVSIGRNCYIGANVQFVPGASVGAYCVVALGSVVTKPLTGDWKLITGMPAVEKKDLAEDSEILVTYPTRPDLPDVHAMSKPEQRVSRT